MYYSFSFSFFFFLLHTHVYLYITHSPFNEIKRNFKNIWNTWSAFVSALFCFVLFFPLSVRKKSWFFLSYIFLFLFSCCCCCMCRWMIHKINLLLWVCLFPFLSFFLFLLSFIFFENRNWRFCWTPVWSWYIFSLFSFLCFFLCFFVCFSHIIHTGLGEAAVIDLSWTLNEVYAILGGVLRTKATSLSPQHLKQAVMKYSSVSPSLFALFFFFFFLFSFFLFRFYTPTKITIPSLMSVPYTHSYVTFFFFCLCFAHCACLQSCLSFHMCIFLLVSVLLLCSLPWLNNVIHLTCAIWCVFGSLLSLSLSLSLFSLLITAHPLWTCICRGAPEVFEQRTAKEILSQCDYLVEILREADVRLNNPPRPNLGSPAHPSVLLHCGCGDRFSLIVLLFRRSMNLQPSKNWEASCGNSCPKFKKTKKTFSWKKESYTTGKQGEKREREREKEKEKRESFLFILCLQLWDRSYSRRRGWADKCWPFVSLFSFSRSCVPQLSYVSNRSITFACASFDWWSELSSDQQAISKGRGKREKSVYDDFFFFLIFFEGIVIVIVIVIVINDSLSPPSLYTNKHNIVCTSQQ